jgi:hypothetical protein
MAKTKAELEKEAFELREELRAQREITEELKRAVNTQTTSQGADFEPKAELLYDPYDHQNALEIIGEIPPNAEYPDGQVLGWKRPLNRASRGWRGWVALQWGDEYTGENGELLKDYVAEPPQRMLDQQDMDSYVRRGDVVLARLDKLIFQSRLRKQELESEARKGLAQYPRMASERKDVTFFGDGFTKSERPSGGYRVNEVPKRDLNYKYPVIKDSEE